MGRSALDQDAIQLIEQHNPDISFDWTRILKGQPDEPETNGGPSQQQPQRAPVARPDRQERKPRSQSDARPKAAVEPEVEPVFVPPLDDGPPTAAHAKLGAEGVLRLRGRYAEMLARIDERTQEAERREELKAIAERLNPDAWVTEADVLAALDSYETSFEALRSVVGRRRRRPRREEDPPE